MIREPPLTGLEQGEFTEITPRIRKIAQRIIDDKTKENLSLPERVTYYLRSNLKTADVKSSSEFRKRTADEILLSRYSNGCTDRALAYITILRALSNPALYVETIKESTFKDLERPWQRGHIFADVLQNGIWVPHEPNIRDNLMNYNIRGDLFIPYAKGVDFTQLYLIEQETGLFYPAPVRDQLPKQAESIARKFYGWIPKEQGGSK